MLTLTQVSFERGLRIRRFRICAELQKEVLAQFAEMKLPDLPKRKLIDSSSDTEVLYVDRTDGESITAAWLHHRALVMVAASDAIFMHRLAAAAGPT